MSNFLRHLSILNQNTTEAIQEYVQTNNTVYQSIEEWYTSWKEPVDSCEKSNHLYEHIVGPCQSYDHIDEYGEAATDSSPDNLQYVVHLAENLTSTNTDLKLDNDDDRKRYDKLDVEITSHHEMQATFCDDANNISTADLVEAYLLAKDSKVNSTDDHNYIQITTVEDFQEPDSQTMIATEPKEVVDESAVIKSAESAEQHHGSFIINEENTQVIYLGKCADDSEIFERSEMVTYHSANIADSLVVIPTSDVNTSMDNDDDVKSLMVDLLERIVINMTHIDDIYMYEKASSLTKLSEDITTSKGNPNNGHEPFTNDSIDHVQSNCDDKSGCFEHNHPVEDVTSVASHGPPHAWRNYDSRMDVGMHLSDGSKEEEDRDMTLALRAIMERRLQMFWDGCRQDIEAMAERKAALMMKQWKREGISFDTAIELSLKEYFDMYQGALAVKLLFEEEKYTWERDIMSKIHAERSHRENGDDFIHDSDAFSIQNTSSKRNREFQIVSDDENYGNSPSNPEARGKKKFKSPLKK